MIYVQWKSTIISIGHILSFESSNQIARLEILSHDLLFEWATVDLLETFVPMYK
jgi:hypothetical protein